MSSGMFRKKTLATLAVSGLLLLAPMGVLAADATQPQEGSGGQIGMHHHMGGEHHKSGMKCEMCQHHGEMKKMHQEMTAELQKQMSALREHAKTMEGVTDEKQLLNEMKKHQQMTDALLGTMLEQREKMHEAMKQHHKQMHERMGKKKAAEGSGTEQSGEHEQHHGK